MAIHGGDKTPLVQEWIILLTFVQGRDSVIASYSIDAVLKYRKKVFMNKKRLESETMVARNYQVATVHIYSHGIYMYFTAVLESIVRTAYNL